jgi:hypothetical protein
LVPLKYAEAVRNNKSMKTWTFILTVLILPERNCSVGKKDMKTWTFILTVLILPERNCCVGKKDMSGKKRKYDSPGIGSYDSSCAF